MLESDVGVMVALTWHEGGRLVNARCQASGATYGPPDTDVAELMVVFGKGNETRLSQLVGVPAAAGGVNANQTASIAHEMPPKSHARTHAALAAGRQRRVVVGFTAASLGSGIQARVVDGAGHDLPLRLGGARQSVMDLRMPSLAATETPS